MPAGWPLSVYVNVPWLALVSVAETVSETAAPSALVCGDSSANVSGWLAPPPVAAVYVNRSWDAAMGDVPSGVVTRRSTAPAPRAGAMAVTDVSELIVYAAAGKPVKVTPSTFTNLSHVIVTASPPSPLPD